MASHVEVAGSLAGDYTAGFNKILVNPTSSSALKLGTLTPAESEQSLRNSPDSTPLDATIDINMNPMKPPLVPGIYVPTICFFDEVENVDTATIAHHAVRLAEAGVTGIATQGSNGEAVHLTTEERKLVTSTTRKALDEAGYRYMPIIVGCGAQSTRETIQHCCDAWQAGGDYALVLPPSYYASLFAPSSETIIKYFRTVAAASPIPLVIYNFPGAVNGMDLSSDTIVLLSEHPNIVGVKLTCGNTGKLNRVAAATRKSTENYNPSRPEFLVLAGSADFTIQSLAVGGHGILAGIANIAPKACIRTMELYQSGQYEEARKLQDVVSQGDWVAIQSGVVGVKAGLETSMGYGGYARSPLPRPTPHQTQMWQTGFNELVLTEQYL